MSTITKLGILGLAAVTLLAGTIAAFAGDDGADDGSRVSNVELRQPEETVAPEVVEEDLDDGDDTAGDDGTGGGNNTGDGDRTRGDDGTGGGNNTGDGDRTRGNDGTDGGNNTGDGDATAGNDGTDGGDNSGYVAAPAAGGDASYDGGTGGGGTTG